MIPDDVARWLDGALGTHRLEAVVQATERSTVWRIATREGRVVVKRYVQARPWHHEVHAYRAWAPALEPFVPRLLASSPELRAVAVSALPGVPMKTIDLPAPVARRITCEAGALARRFVDAGRSTWFGAADADGAPLDAAIADPVAFLRADVRHWGDLIEGAGVLGDDGRAAVERIEDRLGIFAGCPAVPVNVDFDAGNWLVADGRLTGVIDFEFARWGVEAETFVPIWTRAYARRCPDAEAAFVEGYGIADAATWSARRRAMLAAGTVGGLWFAHLYDGEAATAAARARLLAA